MRRNDPNISPFFAIGKHKFKQRIFNFLYYKLLVALIKYLLHINSLIITVT